MKICLYSPYVPAHTGGGEKYLFDVARTLAKDNAVFIAITSLEPLTNDQINTIKQTYRRFLDNDLTGITFIASPLGSTESLITKVWWTKQFDVLYYITDGSLFFSLARKNILHIQIPLLLNKSSLIEQIKLGNWTVKNTNSEFTKSIVEPSWPVKIDYVHHPLIELESVVGKTPAKEKVILSVGRFFTQLHSKRQDKLVELFKKLRQSEPKLAAGWKLVLIGGVEDTSYAKAVAQAAKGMPIEIYHDLSRPELISWYRRASIYWHAAGFGIDQAKEPEKVEHFGISTAEAMLAGCAPVVINRGGQPEILGANLHQWLWETEADLVGKTTRLLKDKDLLREVQAQAQKRATVFGPATFAKTLQTMITA